MHDAGKKDRAFETSTHEAANLRQPIVANRSARDLTVVLQFLSCQKPAPFVKLRPCDVRCTVLDYNTWATCEQLLWLTKVAAIRLPDDRGSTVGSLVRGTVQVGGEVLK
jgi:hypothetical protein